MNIEKKEDLIEQYEDAAFALMMSNYAEQEGIRLLQEFEEAKSRGEVPAIPAELDAKCRKLIHKAYEKERGRERIKKLLHFAGKTAAIWFAIIGICATLVLSVEALRTPVINFLIDQQGRFISIGNTDTGIINPGMTQNMTNDSTLSSFKDLLSDDYTLICDMKFDDGSFAYRFQNASNVSVSFVASISDSLTNLDTENAISEHLVFHGYNSIFVEKDSKLSLTWYNDELNMLFQLFTNGMGSSDFWILAEKTVIMHTEVE